MLTLAVRVLPVGDTQSSRCIPAARSRLARGVTPRCTPSTDTEHHPGDAMTCSRPLPLAGAPRPATGSESTAMTGTSADSSALGMLVCPSLPGSGAVTVGVVVPVDAARLDPWMAACDVGPL